MTPARDDVLTGVWTATRYGRVYARTNRAPPPRESPPVILVHGVVVASRYMVPTARRLAAMTRVYAPDLPGYGRSDKPWPILDLAGLADALAVFLDARAIERAHFLGNSFGCQVLAEFATRHPARVARLVLQGPTVDPQARSLLKQLARSARNSRYEPAALGLISAADYARAGARRAAATLRLALADRIEDKLARIIAPTLVVRGAKDPIVPARWAERATRLLPRGELRVIPGYGHTLNYAAPLELTRVVRPFLGLP